MIVVLYLYLADEGQGLLECELSLGYVVAMVTLSVPLLQLFLPC